MSLITVYGNYKNDLDKIMTMLFEAYKISSAPLIIYPVQTKEFQKSYEHPIYEEYTEKHYLYPREIKGFFKNPTLEQNLIKLGIDMPESLSIFFHIPYMLQILKRPFEVYDLVQVPHQRHQFYIVKKTFPYNASEILFKYTIWHIYVEKEELSGLIIPPYLLDERKGLVSWLPFDSHYKSEFLQDRQAYLEQRRYRIYGDINYFWQKNDIFEQVDCGCFNGIDNYIDVGNTYNFQQPFSISICLKSNDINANYCLFNKGENFRIYLTPNLNLNIFLEDLNIITSQIIKKNEWNYLCFVFSQGNLTIYYNENNLFDRIKKINYNNIGNFNLNNNENFLIGAEKNNNSIINIYRGYMSNFRIFNSALTEAEILNNELLNLKNRPFITI